MAERLAACANLFSPITSVYRWEGAIDRTREVPMTLKTTADAAPALRDFIRARHPYEIPCILAIRADPELSDAAFLAWVAGET